MIQIYCAEAILSPVTLTILSHMGPDLTGGKLKDKKP